jgi:hypothetical protein
MKAGQDVEAEEIDDPSEVLALLKKFELLYVSVHDCA